MKKIVLLLALFTSSSLYAQMYADYSLGLAYKPDGNSSLIGLHLGYQFNNIFFPDGIVLMEYDQRALTKGLSPLYLGGRIGYGMYTGETTSFVLWGGHYYRQLSSDDKELNNWVPGYGLSFVWKSVILDVSKIEFYQISLGCHYSFDD
jgi:hypothetical protein